MQLKSPAAVKEDVRVGNISHLTSHPLFDSGGADVSKTLPVMYTAIEGELKNVEACAGSRFPKVGDELGPLI